MAGCMEFELLSVDFELRREMRYYMKMTKGEMRDEIERGENQNIAYILIYFFRGADHFRWNEKIHQMCLRIYKASCNCEQGM